MNFPKQVATIRMELSFMPRNTNTNICLKGYYTFGQNLFSCISKMVGIACQNLENYVIFGRVRKFWCSPLSLGNI